MDKIQALARTLAAELQEMDDQGAIELEMWPTARELIEAVNSQPE